MLVPGILFAFFNGELQKVRFMFITDSFTSLSAFYRSYLRLLLHWAVLFCSLMFKFSGGHLGGGGRPLTLWMTMVFCSKTM